MLRDTMSAPHPAAVPNTDRRWELLTRVAFRLTFCYLLLHCVHLAGILTQFLGYATKHSLGDFLDPLWHRVVPWVGTHVLHLGRGIIVPGAARSSGDTTYDYVVIVCELVVAAVGALIWSVLDRKRPNYRVLNEWLRFAVKLILAGLLFACTDKVFPLQFGTLSLATLSQRVGDLSPMDLLWTFMAGSKAYTVFTGAVEVIAGILLRIPRCTTLGALISNRHGP